MAALKSVPGSCHRMEVKRRSFPVRKRQDMYSLTRLPASISMSTDSTPRRSTARSTLPARLQVRALTKKASATHEADSATSRKDHKTYRCISLGGTPGIKWSQFSHIWAQRWLQLSMNDHLDPQQCTLAHTTFELMLIAAVFISLKRESALRLLCAAAQYTTPFTASTNLSVLMLNNFLSFLDQTDVTQVTWAQYMDIVCCDGQGLLDYFGNARPAWHSFKFWGDIPVERVVSHTDCLRCGPCNPSQ